MSEKNVSYSKLVALIRKQINEVRFNPFYYVGYLNSKKTRFDSEDPRLFYPLKKLKELSVQTKEGEKALNEAIHFLTKQTTSVTLMWSYELHLIAHKKASRLAKTEKIMPEEVMEEMFEIVQEGNLEELQPGTELDNEGLKLRRSSEIARKNTGINSSSHNAFSTQPQQTELEIREGVECVIDQEHYLIYYGVIDPKELIAQILIDDGFLQRQHRKALFNKKLNYIGIGIHEHPTHYFVVVILMANHIRKLKKEEDSSDTNCTCGII